MTTTEQALKAAKGAVLPETLAQQTGRTPQETVVDLSMLNISGKAEEVGGRWQWVGSKAPKLKGATVRRKGEPRPAPARPGVASRPRGRIYPIQVVTTRWKDSATGRFVKKPQQDVPLKLKVGRAKTTDGMIITKVHKTDTLTGLRVPVKYNVQYLEARRAHERGELGAKELRALERDIADGLLSEEGQAILAKVDAAHMRQSHQSDKAKRAAVTRKKNAATKKHRTATDIRADHLKASNDLVAARSKLGKAKTAKAQESYRTRMRNLNLKLGRLQKEAKSAGVAL